MFRPLVRCLFLAAACACLVSRAPAQELDSAPAKDPMDLSLEELINVRVDSVYGASKYTQKVTEAPASVSIVTASEIKMFGYRTLADVLRAMRGFYVSSDRNYSYLGSRGFLRPGDYNTRYLFLIDGHRLNDNIYDSAWIGNDAALDVDLIDRVEVIRGPSSSIYGNSAFFGVVNLITKKGRQIDGIEASTEAGSFDTYKGRFSMGKKFTNDVEFLFSGSYYTSAGQRALYYPEFDQRISADPRARNDGMALDVDGEESHQFFTSLAYHDFTLSGLYSSRTKYVPTAAFGEFFGVPIRTTDERAYADLKYTHQFSEDTELTARAAYDVYPYMGRYPFDSSTNNLLADVRNDYDGAYGEWLTTELQVKQRVFDRHTLIAGAEFRDDLKQHLFNYDDLGNNYLDDHRNGRNYAAYLQAEVVLRTNLLLNAGFRYDYYYSFGGTLNPRVGLIYDPWEKTTFKALFGQAFRAPNDYELYYGVAGSQAANSSLKPETIRTYELIWEQYLPAHLRFSASAYHYDIDKLISQTIQAGTGLPIFDNVDRVRADGVEFELEEKLPGGLLARASYALQHAEDAATGMELTSSPRHLVKGNLIVPLYRDKVFGGVELQYQSAVRTLSGGRAGDFTLVNLNLFSQKIVKGLEVSVGVYNLFDTRYAYPASVDFLQDTITQDGRSFRAKLTYKF